MSEKKHSPTVQGLINTVEAQRHDRSPYLKSPVEWFLADQHGIERFYRVREYLIDDPWLFVRFLDAEGSMIGVFHHPGGLAPPDTDYMVLPGKFIAPSADLLKAIQGVIDG